MQRAIDFAWEANLQLSKDNQWKTKEEIIKTFCPSEYGFKDTKPCPQQGDNYNECFKCWDTREKIKKSTYKKFEQEIREVNNKYLIEMHKEFINKHNLNMKDVLILSKFLEFMTEHE